MATIAAIEADTEPTCAEKLELQNILRSLRLIREYGGWGTVVVTMKSGVICEVQTAYTEKIHALLKNSGE